ncbi:MAG: polyprenyl synthetase family protein [Acidobacteria bacterium]|nr:polyprenyl synthetase family protein [Acidobacteriota bacterium]
MRYGLMGGGKRLRPCLTLATAEAIALRDRTPLGDARARALPAACAIEFIHSYSLVHDDLPAMDDDILRRGRPTTHVVHGDGMAVLAGDGLLTHAFALIAEGPAPPDRRLRATLALATAAGAHGMVGGQAIDLIAAGKVTSYPATPMDAVTLKDMHARKTGALLRAAATMGAILSGADAATIAAVDRYATDLGLAFQIVDDILDVESSNEALGKTVGKDAAAGKPTYPSLYGLDASKRLAADCITRAKIAIASARLGGLLPEIADLTVSRKS